MHIAALFKRKAQSRSTPHNGICGALCAEGIVVKLHLIGLYPPPPPIRRRSLSSYITTALAPTEQGPGLTDDTFESTASNTTTNNNEADPCTPGGGDEGVSMRMQMSSAPGESWARGIFDKRRDQAAMGSEKRQVPQVAPAVSATREGSPALAAAAATGYPSPGFIGAFGGDAVTGAHHPEDWGLVKGSDFGPGTGSSAVSTVTSSYSTVIGRETVEAGKGGTAAAAAPPSPAKSSAGHGEDCAHPEGGGSATLSPLSSVPPVSPPSAESSITANLHNVAPGRQGTEGLELWNASDLDGANADGLMDVVDALLGETVLEEI